VKHVGAVYFEQVNNVIASDHKMISLDRGWASIDGGPARRINSLNELPSGVLWYTNLKNNDFFLAQLHRHPNYRDESWLRTQFGQLCAELGLVTQQVPVYDSVPLISALALRVIEAASDRYCIAPNSKRRLNEDFADQMAAPRSTVADQYYDKFREAAEHPTVTVLKSHNYTGYLPFVTVRRNRLRHAREVLATRVPPPDAGWELRRNSLPERSDAWLEAIDTPFLAHCKVEGVDKKIADVISWGSGAKNPREWLTDVEWRVVRQYGRVEVASALVCKQPGIVLEQAERLPSDPFADLSLTLGLIAEQIWTALTTKRPYRATESRYATPAAWLRSTDRMLMFDYAQKLVSRGLPVHSYGVGNVVLRYPEGGLRNLIKIATEFGLLPPANMVAEARENQAV